MRSPCMQIYLFSMYCGLQNMINGFEKLNWKSFFYSGQVTVATRDLGYTWFSHEGFFFSLNCLLISLFSLSLWAFNMSLALVASLLYTQEQVMFSQLDQKLQISICSWEKNSVFRDLEPFSEMRPLIWHHFISVLVNLKASCGVALNFNSSNNKYCSSKVSLWPLSPQVILAELYSTGFQRSFSDEDDLTAIADSDVVYAFQAPPLHSHGSSSSHSGKSFSPSFIWPTAAAALLWVLHFICAWFLLN